MRARTTPGHDRRPVLLYDGECGFCSRIVAFVLKRDRRRAVLFMPLQDAARAGLSVDTESVGWMDAGGRLHTRSDAVLHVATYLGGAWRLAGAARVVPRRLRDAAYDLVAARRYRIMPQACFIPTADERGRFLRGDAAVRWISARPVAI